MLNFINGNFINAKQPAILSSDRGFLLGDGVFTTIKVINTHLIHFAAHYRRLKQNSATIQLPLNYSEQTLSDICQELIKINNLVKETVIIRISLTRGESKRGIDIPLPCNPTIVISAAVNNAMPVKPLSLVISSYKRNEYSPIIHIKAPNHLESVLAREEAKKSGYNDGLLTNTKGYICETTIANIFFIQAGEIYTPQICDGILPGITRQFIFELAKEAGLTITEVSIDQNEINIFDECFITNCVSGIQEVDRIGGQLFKTNDIIRLINNKYVMSLETYTK